MPPQFDIFSTRLHSYGNVTAAETEQMRLWKGLLGGLARMRLLGKRDVTDRA